MNPDVTVEVVMEAIKMYGGIANDPEFHRREAERIVALVRTTDKAQVIAVLQKTGWVS
jgi:hypothetical protein